MSWKERRIGSFLLVLPLLASCVSAANNVTYLAELEPPARYNHPYDGPVVERVIPLAEVVTHCAFVGFYGVACGWVSNNTCYRIIPSDGQAPVPVYRRHETAHCNGWASNHPRDD